MYMYSKASRYAEVQALHTQRFKFCSKDWDFYNLDYAMWFHSTHFFKIQKGPFMNYVVSKSAIFDPRPRRYSLWTAPNPATQGLIVLQIQILNFWFEHCEKSYAWAIIDKKPSHGDFVKLYVSEICVKQIWVNQGVGVCPVHICRFFNDVIWQDFDNSRYQA